MKNLEIRITDKFLERYFIKTYYETGPVFEIKYKI